MTAINEAIGGTGLMSWECKTVVSQYGDTIIDMLLQEASLLNEVIFPSVLNFLLLPSHVVHETVLMMAVSWILCPYYDISDPFFNLVSFCPFAYR